MSDGLTVPNNADGMASFKGSNGKIILIRNHEIGHFDKIDKLLQLNSLYKEKKYIKKNFPPLIRYLINIRDNNLFIKKLRKYFFLPCQVLQFQYKC